MDSQDIQEAAEGTMEALQAALSVADGAASCTISARGIYGALQLVLTLACDNAALAGWPEDAKDAEGRRTLEAMMLDLHLRLGDPAGR